MQAVFAATGADTVQDWLRTDLPAIIMTVSGAYVLSRFIAFVADQQILQSSRVIPTPVTSPERQLALIARPWSARCAGG